MTKATKTAPIVEDTPVEEVTQSEYELIISGKAMPILAPEHPGGLEWFIKQPDDWLYDMADSVRQVALAQAMADPDIAAGKTMPPSEEWTAKQKASIQKRTEEIAALKEKMVDGGTDEQRLELQALEINLKNLYKPGEFSLADEVALPFSNRVYEAWLLRRLVVDKDGNLLFDPKTEVGNKAWTALGREIRTNLRIPLYNMLFLIQAAKNSQGGRPSA